MITISRITRLALAVSAVLVFTSNAGFAQSVGISNSTFTPNTNSVLELKSTVKGVLLPRMDSGARTTLGGSLGPLDEGMTLYNTTDDVYEYWNGAAWVVIGTAGGYDDDWTVVGADIERQSGDVYIGDLSTTNNDLYISGTIIDWDNSSYFLDPSAATGSRLNEVEFDDGSTSDPSVWFDGDANSGMYQPANNQIGLVAAGNERIRVVSSGVSIGGNSDAPNALMDVVGGTTGSSSNLMTLRSDFTATNTGTALRLINSTSATSDVGSELEALTTDATNGFSNLILRVHGSGGASGDLEERMRIQGDGEVRVGTTSFPGKITFPITNGGFDYDVTIAPSPTTGATWQMTLPPDDGDANDILVTDGSGVLSWVDPALLPSDADWTISGNDQYSGVTGNVGIGATTPFSKLEVYDAAGPTLTITKDGADASSLLFRNGTGGSAADGSSIGLNSAEHLTFTNSIINKDMFFNVNVAGAATDVLFVDGGTGRIGINNTAPDYDLEVGGDIGVDTEIVHAGDDDTRIQFTTDRLQFFAGTGTTSPMIDIQESTTDEVTINEGGLNWDFRVEGGDDVNLIVADGSTDLVGIGTNTPSAKLEVYDEEGASGIMARLTKNSNTAGELAGIGFGVQDGFSYAKSAIIHERESANGTGKLHFLVDDQVDPADVALTESRMTIDRDGLVGIGTTSPLEELHVVGDIRSTTLSAGNVQADANGTLIISSDIPSGDADYIHNQNAVDQAADFRISGDGSILKGLTMGDGITIDNDNLNAGTVSTQSLAFGNASGEAIGSKRTAGGNQNGLDFFTATAARLSIENGGHVGINNTAPGNPLHVVGLSTADFDVARFDGSSTFGAAVRVSSTAAGGRDWTMISTANAAGEGAGKLLFKDETGGNVLMTIENGGNVGIGTTAPAAKLDVAGTIALNDNGLRLRGGGDGNHYLAHVGGAFDGPKLNGQSSVVLSTNTGGLGGNDLVVNNGRVGINIATPTQGLLHVNGFYNNNAGNFAYYSVGGSGCFGGGCSGATDVSIYASNRIQASEFNAYSDARIKNIHSVTDGAEDIQTIMGIEITNYTKIDQRSGKGMEKKVIAQQVEQVYPQAVSKGVDVIPNIYQLSKINEGRINVANELEPGCNVRLIFEDRTTLTEVLTADLEGFTVALEDQGQVFVYGEEVNDFRSVDYEAISMLNISATQELYKMILNLQQENVDVKAELSRVDALSSELEEIKATLGIGLQSAK